MQRDFEMGLAGQPGSMVWCGSYLIAHHVHLHFGSSRKRETHQQNSQLARVSKSTLRTKFHSNRFSTLRTCHGATSPGVLSLIIFIHIPIIPSSRDFHASVYFFWILRAAVCCLKLSEWECQNLLKKSSQRYSDSWTFNVSCDYTELYQDVVS